MPPRREPFKGKRFHKDLREFKTQEIKRSLVHKSRLKKSYFKLLEQEGESVPEKQSRSDDKKQLDFTERAKLAKERKERDRQQRLLQVQEKRGAIEKARKKRVELRNSLTKKTKTGQPSMGPKISNLLDKIRKSSD